MCLVVLYKILYCRALPSSRVIKGIFNLVYNVKSNDQNSCLPVTGNYTHRIIFYLFYPTLCIMGAIRIQLPKSIMKSLSYPQGLFIRFEKFWQAI